MRSGDLGLQNLTLGATYAILGDHKITSSGGVDVTIDLGAPAGILLAGTKMPI
jgi:hypothetical protein